MKKVMIVIGIVLLIIVLAGMYKFNYLANKSGYDADGNKLQVALEYNNKEPMKDLAQDIRVIESKAFQKLAESREHIIIDIRTPEELLPINGGQIFEEVLNIDFYKSDFQQELQKLDPDEKYLIYCRSGNRSGKTLEIMRNLGFKNVADLAGGKIAWDNVF